jgi:hypothetical protein
MQMLQKKEVDTFLKDKKEIVFKKEISELKPGEAIKISTSEWTQKTNPWIYYRAVAKMPDLIVKKKGDFWFIIKP